MRLSPSLLPVLPVLLALAACGPDPGDAPADAGRRDDADGDDTDHDTDDDTGDAPGDDTGRDTGEDTGGDTGDAVQAPADPAAFAALTREARAALTQDFTLDAGAGGSITGAGGTVVQLAPGSLVDAAGAVVSGDVDLSLIEVFDKGSMLVAGVAPVGLQGDGSHAQLISGGEHYVAAAQDGGALALQAPLALMVPVDATGGVDEAMGPFRGFTADGEPAGAEDGVVWKAEDPERFAIRGGGADGAATAYWMMSSQFGWTNIDRWYADSRPKTTIHVSVPAGWDDQNCAVYLSYDGEPTALASFDVYDEDSGLFTEHYGLIPIGLQVHVIFVTEADGLWSHAIQAHTIAEDHLVVFDDPGEFEETDLDGLVAAINALP